MTLCTNHRDDRAVVVITHSTIAAEQLSDARPIQKGVCHGPG
ncbi:hypothetical protein [Geoalkalibacter halelectricus]